MKRLLPFILLFLVTVTVSAQPPANDKAELEKERKDIQNELREIQGMYDQVKGQTKQSLGQLNMINRKITLQERYINSINKEVRYIDDDIYLSNLEIYRLQRQLDTLKTQYARTIVYSYKNRSSFDYVNFIFSANSFNDAIRRISYLKSYRAYREQQVVTIKETQDLIAKRQKQQLGRKEQKSQALESQIEQRSELSEQRKEKDAVVSKLKSQEKDLQGQIATKKKRDNNIKNAITAIIRRDIENAKKEEAIKTAAANKADADRRAAAAAAAKANNTSSNNSTAGTTPKVTAPVAEKKDVNYLEMNATDVAMGADFAMNKGKLPWPVDRAVVSVPYGPYHIEGTKLIGDNPGLTLVTPAAGVSVKAVFDGVVSGISNYGEGILVVIKHGKYSTAYSNLSGVSVTKGQSIKTGQVIGKAGENEDGSGGQIDFILMVDKNQTNPAIWLRR